MKKIDELKKDNLTLNTKIVPEQLSAPIDNNIKSVIEEQAGLMEIKTYNMPSMAGHDAKNVSKSNVPTGMIFVKSVRGESGAVSHTPDEDTPEGSIKKGTKLLLSTVYDLANKT